MPNRLFTLAGGVLIGTAMTAATLLSCQHMVGGGDHDDDAVASSQRSRNAESQPTSAPSITASALSPQELRNVLSDMAHSHADKIKLSWGVSTPFRPVSPAFHPFFDNMGKQNKELLAELQGWAKQNHVDLAYRPANDLDGRADKLTDERQEKMLRADDKAAFEHDILIQMYSDYESGLSQTQVLLPTVKDPALKSYLEKCEKMFSDGRTEILSLLHRYKFQ